MHRNKLIAIAVILLFGQDALAQELYHSTSISDAIRKGTRTLDGKPGTAYWQNGADYAIKVNVDPTSNNLSGEEEISYTNNSPDTLRRLIIRLYPDLYKKGVGGNSMFPINPKDQNDGVSIDALTIGTETISDFADNRKAFHNGTNLFVTPAEAILPHSSRTLKVKWHYTINTGSPVRTGLVDPGSYFIAYFFPRLSVYDDINGWDDWSYNGTQEFYNDFSNFNVEITLPKNDVVWATGDRIGEEANLGSSIIQKLQQAKHSDNTIVHVIDSNDYSKNAVINPLNTGVWKFSATGVTDFAFAFSDHYLWDAASVLTDSATGKRTLASAAFNKIHKDYFDVGTQAWQSVYYMSHRYPKWPFPFPYITVFDGTDQMEYPMMVNDNPTETHKDAVQLTTHEIFHSYFPFYMGINETEYAWMDEGWATIGESVISPIMGEPEDEGIFSKTRFERISGTDKDVPLITNTKLYQDAAYLANSYGKGGVCYYVLQDMLGDDLYFKALHQYMRDWHGKHPIPYDFFYSMNSGSGQNLDWFWKKWFFDWVYPDLSIDKVKTSASGATISIENKGGLPLPVFITILFNNGHSKTLHYGADVWKDGKKMMQVVEKTTDGIKSVTLGNAFVPDKFNDNNFWGKH